MSDRYAHIQDRSERYAARVDDHLKTLPSNAERLSFLKAQYQGWQQRYQEFQIDVECKVIQPNGATAFDYLCTILDLEKRIGALEQAREAA